MNMMRMVIGETISEAQVKDFVNAFDSDVRKELAKEPGFLEVQVMTEDGGNMVVISTVGKTGNIACGITAAGVTANLWPRLSICYSGISL